MYLHLETEGIFLNDVLSHLCAQSGPYCAKEIGLGICQDVCYVHAMFGLQEKG